MRKITTTRKNFKWSKMFDNQKVYFYATGAWNSINQRTANGKYSFSASVSRNAQQISYFKKGITLEMTQEEFLGFCAANSDLIQSIYDSGEKPSTDRIDESRGYCIDNIQIIPLSENLHRKNKSGLASKSCDPLAKKIQNRFAYIANQIPGSYDPLNIDALAGEDIAARHIASAIVLGLIQEPFGVLDEAKYPVEWLASWRAQEEAKKQAKLEAAYVAKEKRVRLAEKKTQKKEYKEIKNHPFYKDVTKMIKNRKLSINPSKNPNQYDSIIFDNGLKNREKIILIISAMEGAK